MRFKLLENNLTETLSNRKPYMLRNDGELFEISESELSDFGTFVHPYIFDTDIIDPKQVTIEQVIYRFFKEYGLPSMLWFYSHTQYKICKKEISRWISSIIQHPVVIAEYKDSINYLKRIIDVEDICLEDGELITSYLNISNALNEEFCRVRYSGKYREEKGSKEIWFRISSIGFNWFNLIWNIVYKYSNSIEYVNVCKDLQSTNNEDYYVINNKQMNHFPVKEFLVLEGNPIVESVWLPVNKMREGKPLFEAIQGNPVLVCSSYYSIKRDCEGIQ